MIFKMNSILFYFLISVFNSINSGAGVPPFLEWIAVRSKFRSFTRLKIIVNTKN